MATIYKCDKCHQETTNESNLTKIDIERESHFGELSIYIKTELCPRCLRALREWITPDPIVRKQ